jgi:hypothetical protein
LQAYFEKFAQKYDLYPFIKLNSRVISATWDEAKGIYNVKVNCEGKEIDDWCHVLINGTGFLNDWKWPKYVFGIVYVFQLSNYCLESPVSTISKAHYSTAPTGIPAYPMRGRGWL